MTIIARAIDAGYTGFCLTADTQTYSRRERDMLKGFTPPSGRRPDGADFAAQARMTWDTVQHIKSEFDIPLIIKGVNVAEDARRCVETGVDRGLRLEPWWASARSHPRLHRCPARGGRGR